MQVPVELARLATPQDPVEEVDLLVVGGVAQWAGAAVRTNLHALLQEALARAVTILVSRICWHNNIL